MNYFELHIGDYAQATAHLSFVEDAAYLRLIRKYYSDEKPLPADIKAVQRLAGARTKEEKKAVETVLSEFFFLSDDGWHNSRCDAEILKYLSGAPEREVKKANESNRLKRHREERAVLFKSLTDAGFHAPWNIPMDELRERVRTISAGIPATAPETPPATPETPPATAPATPATATQTPIPNTQNIKPGCTASVVNSTSDARGLTAPAAQLSKALRDAGVEAQPADPRILALSQRGVTPETLKAAAEEAKRAKPNERIPVGYVIGIVERWARDAEAVAAGPAAKPPGAVKPQDTCCCCGRTATKRIGQRWYCQEHDQFSERAAAA